MSRAAIASVIFVALSMPGWSAMGEGSFIGLFKHRNAARFTFWRAATLSARVQSTSSRIATNSLRERPAPLNVSPFLNVNFW